MPNRLPFGDADGNPLYCILFLSKFRLANLSAIYIEAWQTDIRVGHLNGKDSIELSAASRVQCRIQQLVRIAHIVATSHYCIEKSLTPFPSPRRGENKIADKLLHHIRYAPSIDREDETDYVIVRR